MPSEDSENFSREVDVKVVLILLVCHYLNQCSTSLVCPSAGAEACRWGECLPREVLPQALMLSSDCVHSEAGFRASTGITCDFPSECWDRLQNADYYMLGYWKYGLLMFLKKGWDKLLLKLLLCKILERSTEVTFMLGLSAFMAKSWLSWPQK